MASNNGFSSGLGRARGRSRGRGVDVSIPPAQVGIPRSAAPPPVARAPAPVQVPAPAPVLSTPPGLVQQQQPPAQQVQAQVPPQARAPPAPRPVGGLAAVENGVARMSVGGRRSGGDGSGGPNGDAPRRPRMEGDRRGDDSSNEGYFLDPEMGRTGSSGRVVPLSTNYVRLQDLPNATYHQHSLSFSPYTDDVRLMRFLAYQGCKDLCNGKMICDAPIFYTWSSIGNEGEPIVVRATAKDLTEYEITITYVSVRTTVDPQTMPLLGRMLRQCTGKIGLKEMGKTGASFDMAPESLFKTVAGGYQLEIASGYITAIRRYEKDVLMNVYTLHKVFRKELVIDVMNRVMKEFRKEQVREKVIEELVGSVIITRYNDKTYRIDDVAFDLNPNSPWNDEGQTYAEYYQEKYGIEIKNLTQPLLVSRLKDKDRRRGNTGVIHLIPEVCEMTGLTDKMRADFRTMKAIAEKTRMGPSQRVQSIKQLMKRLCGNKDVTAELDKFKVRFEGGLFQVNARVLNSVKIVVGGNVEAPNRNGDWSGAMKSKVLSPQPLEKWLVLYRKDDAKVADECLRAIGNVCAGMGMRHAPPRKVELLDGRPATYHNKLLENMTPKDEMILCIVPDDMAARYNTIKALTYVENAIPSQVVTVKTLTKKQGAGGSMLMSVCTKLVMQMNCKMGGALWRVNIPLQDTVIMGYDTFHDTVNKKKSVGALVSSIDSTFTRFGSFVSFHENQTEMSDHMTIGVTKILNDHGLRDGNKWIKRLILYRDGVGEGQVSFVVKHEIQAVINAVKEFDPEINVAVVIVSKRIHSQFYQKGPKDDYVNPGPGTVIDTGVTNQHRHDFFLIPQSVRQGTVNPVNFNVCVNTGVRLNMDKFQTLTYMLCHLYYNWPGTVRVPAPVQYAHKLAFLVGQSLHRAPNQGLSNTLYFL